MKTWMLFLVAVIVVLTAACGGPVVTDLTPPMAHIVVTEHAIGGVGEPVLWFDASPSEGQIVKYHWFVHEPCFDPLMGTSTNGDLLVIVPLCAGDWTVDVKVTDINGAVSSTSATVVLP